jgi:hypothetical protein
VTVSAPAAAAGPRAASPAVAAAWAAAGLSFGSACLHGSVMVTHFREYLLFGLFFAIVTPLQVAWAELVRRSPEHRRLLLAGAVGNALIAYVWLLSRTVGLPVGPDGHAHAEAVGVKDVLATAGELLLAGLVVAVLRRRTVAGPVVALAWSLTAAGVVVALVGGGGH